MESKVSNCRTGLENAQTIVTQQGHKQKESDRATHSSQSKGEKQGR
jgi:hypothetical protein